MYIDSSIIYLILCIDFRFTFYVVFFKLYLFSYYTISEYDGTALNDINITDHVCEKKNYDFRIINNIFITR